MNKNKLILAIETSCDETAASVIKGEKDVQSNVIFSQADIHQKFGGVVPEVASRYHVEAMTRVIDEAMREADVTFADLDAIAVCNGPGLVGSLIVGVTAAKTLALAHNIPLIGVHHIAGHIYAANLEHDLQFPLIALVVSGGHTELILMRDHLQFEYLGRTLDDAVGEAYDKVARLLNVGYPGGPIIDKMAQDGEDTYDLPRVWLEAESLDFSFSGLKSAVVNLIHNEKQRGRDIHPENLAASFQASVIEVLTEKTMRAIRKYGVKNLVVAGGVAANSGLRASLTSACELDQVALKIPKMAYCTDNAAMIGAAGSVMYEAGITHDLLLEARPNLDLPKQKITSFPINST